MLRFLLVLPLLVVLISPSKAEDRRPLKELLTDLGSETRSVRQTAQRALEFGSDLPSHPLHPVRFHPKVWERLELLRDEAKPLLPEILALMDHEGTDVVASALHVVTMMGSDARPAIPKLNKLLADHREDGIIAISAGRALLTVLPENQPVTPLIIAAFEKSPARRTWDRELQEAGDANPNRGSESPNGAFFGINFCAEMLWTNLLAAGRTRVEVPALAQVVSTSSSLSAKLVAIGVLAGLGTEAEAALPVLYKQLQDPNELVRLSAAVASVLIERNPDNIAILAKKLSRNEEERTDLQVGAREVLKEGNQLDVAIIESMKESVEFGVTACLGMLKHGRNFHQRKALAYLAKLGPAAKSAVPALNERLSHPDEEIRRLVAETLRRIKEAKGGRK